MVKRLVRDSAVPITLLVGPPCSGKSTYARTHAGPHDLIVDFDAMLSVMSVNGSRNILLPFICEARDALLRRLSRPSDIERAYVITYGATRDDRARFGPVDLLVFDVPAEECKRRARIDKRPAATFMEIDKWWMQFEIPVYGYFGKVHSRTW